jgi:hypothetical protein
MCQVLPEFGKMRDGKRTYQLILNISRPEYEQPTATSRGLWKEHLKRALKAVTQLYSPFDTVLTGSGSVFEMLESWSAVQGMGLDDSGREPVEDRVGVPVSR